jgi:hypothetical protein
MKNNYPLQNNPTAIRNLSIIVSLSILFGFGIFFIIVLWAFPTFSVNASGKTDWTMLEGFASVISLSLLAGGLIFAITEYINAENAKLKEKLAEDREKAKLSYDIYNAIYHKLTDPEQEAARRWILLNITIKKEDEDIESWYERTNKAIMAKTKNDKDGLPEGQVAVKLTLNCLDYIGFIADHYWEVQKDSLDWISAPIAKIWRRIGPYVLHVRKLRNTTDYYLSAERVGNLCVDHRVKKGLPDEEIAKATP